MLRHAASRNVDDDDAKRELMSENVSAVIWWTVDTLDCCKCNKLGGQQKMHLVLYGHSLC